MQRMDGCLHLLLNKYKIELDNNDIKKEDLKNYVRQKPNKRIFGVKFHLYIHNLAKQDKDKGISGWLKKIGEEPVIFDDYMATKASQQLQKYLNDKGYFEAVVRDTVTYKKQKVDVKYIIETHEPYNLGKISYEIGDTVVAKIILKDALNTVIEPGNAFDTNVLDEERGRLEGK